MKLRVAKKVWKRYHREMNQWIATHDSPMTWDPLSWNELGPKEFRGSYVRQTVSRAYQHLTATSRRIWHRNRARYRVNQPTPEQVVAVASNLWRQKMGNGGGILGLMHPPDSSNPIERVGLWWKNRTPS